MEEEQKPDFWFVLRDMKRPNAHDSGYLSLLEMPELQGDLFIPLKQMIYNHFGKRIIKQIPLYQDLIFLHRSRPEAEAILKNIPSLQFRYVKGKKATPMTIPSSSMNDFIAVVQSTSDIIYYNIDEVSEELYGKRIRIIGGNLHGKEGRLLSRRGSKVKRLIVELPQCNLAASVSIDPDCIQLLK